MGNTSSLSEISKAQLSANTTLSGNLSKADAAYDAIGAAAEADIDSLLSSAFETLRSTGFDGVAGLEIGKVVDMQAAITQYVNNIQGALNPLNEADATAVFGKDISEAVHNFVKEVKDSCNAVISNMQSFNDDLTAIKTAMEAKKNSVNTTVQGAASNLNSATSGWKYSGPGETN